METTQESWRSVALLDTSRRIFHQKLDQMRAAQVRRRTYSATVSELESLADRDLSDLGIARSDIKRLAMEAVYGS